jgi:hypothetical protein
MLTVFAMAMVLQQAAGSGVVWQTPAPEPAPASVISAPPVTSDLPDWALADPFSWERSQCSPLIRGGTSLEACQARVRAELSVALGGRLPAGLQPSGQPVPCQAMPGDDGAYPVQCGLPERQSAQAAAPQEQICDSRPRAEGGAVSFTTECRPANARESNGLSFKLFGGDR